MTYVTSEPFVGHLGLGGVGDSRGLMESELRRRDIRWITNAGVVEVRADAVVVQEHDGAGQPSGALRTLPAKYSMLLPAFAGVDVVAAVEGLCDPRGFVNVDRHQRSTRYPEIFAAGACVAIAQPEPTSIPTGVPTTGIMVESMVTTVVRNIEAELAGRPARHEVTLNAVCLADMGDGGAAFVALPQMPPRTVTWAKASKRVHVAKIAFEKHFLFKMRRGSFEPVYERHVLGALGMEHLQDPANTEG
jgi:sulfide:quinone oxidoreductase